MMKLSYEEMLERGFAKLPRHVTRSERFAIPEPDVRQFGRRTLILNFKEICDELRRDPDHLLKFLSGELATLATFDGVRAVFKGNFNPQTIRGLIRRYTERYVICPVCKRPDTKIVREKRLWFLQCEACGARSSLGTS